jgi:hypothetical protein
MWTIVKPNKSNIRRNNEVCNNGKGKQLPLESLCSRLNQKGHEFRMQTMKSLHKIHAKTTIITKA